MVQSRKARGPAGSAWVRFIVPMAVIAFGIAAVAAVALLVPKRKSDAPPPRTVPVNVKVWLVAAEPILEDAFELVGVVEPNRVIDVAAEVPAKVEAYGPRNSAASPLAPYGLPAPRPSGADLAEGDPVRVGQPLIYLNTDLLKADHEYAKAQAEYDQLELKRVQELFDRNVATRQELNQAITAAARSTAALDSALARLQRAVIVSPLNGVLNRLPAEVGEYVRDGAVVAEIVDSGVVKVVVDVPERDVQYLRVGRAERVRFDHHGDSRHADGQITYLSALADPQTRTTRVEITVDNRLGLLRSGKIVRVQLARRTLHDVIMVPLGAVIPAPVESSDLASAEQETTEYLVFVVEDGKAQPRRVRLDQDVIKDLRVRVHSQDLREGELLVVSGQRFVGPGQEVRITEGASPAGAPATQPEASAAAPPAERRPATQPEPVATTRPGDPGEPEDPPPHP